MMIRGLSLFRTIFLRFKLFGCTPLQVTNGGYATLGL